MPESNLVRVDHTVSTTTVAFRCLTNNATFTGECTSDGAWIPDPLQLCSGDALTHLPLGTTEEPKQPLVLSVGVALGGVAIGVLLCALGIVIVVAFRCCISVRKSIKWRRRQCQGMDAGMVDEDQAQPVYEEIKAAKTKETEESLPKEKDERGFLDTQENIAYQCLPPH